ncbi:hypothetical protein ID866_12718 [Astraeus odoratus]|nr:hypothetical protein ID866_12718 [Astraeus odoratus]
MQDQEKKRRVEVWKEEHRQRQDEAEKRAREEAEHLAHEEAAKKAQEEAERKAEEERKVQEEAARAREEAERRAKEAVAREEAVRRAAKAAEERADAERRALEEQLWEVAGQRSEMVVAPPRVAKPSGRMTMVGPSAPGWRASGVQDPCTRCRNKGTSCVLGIAKGKTLACEACRHTKVSCSWMKKMAGETCKRKQVRHSEEMEGREVVDMDVDDDEDEERLHFAAIETIADELRRANDLKEEEMGRSKGKGKEKAQEEFRGARMEDDDGDMEMGGAGPSSLA